MRASAKQGRQHSSQSNRSVAGSGHALERRPNARSKRRTFQDNSKVIAETPPIPEDQAEVVLVVEEQLRVFMVSETDPKAVDVTREN